MLAELAEVTTGFIGLCIRAALGRNAKGQPDPNHPVNRKTIFIVTMTVFVVLACIGAGVVLWLGAGIRAALITAGITLAVGLITAVQAALP